MFCCFLRTTCVFFAMSVIVSAGDSKEMSFPLPDGSKIDMVWVEPGSFTMGSPESEQEREANEISHKVIISKGFWIGKYEVTQGQWESVMNTRPWEGQVFVIKDKDHPAVYISWNHAQDFISKINRLDGKNLYRLPTEAEWEYACRAGTTTAYSFGDDVRKLDEYGWHGKNTYDLGNMFAQKVGQKLPNRWGIYDMHGNVWEWVQDYYGEYSAETQIDPKVIDKGTNRVFRGGSFYYLSRFARSAYRGYNMPTHRLFNLGFRIVIPF